MTERRVVRTAAAGCGLLLAATGLAAAPAAGISATAHRESVTIVLRSPHPAALAALSRSYGLSHAKRIARLDRLTPRRAAITHVRHRLAEVGIDAVQRTAWTLTGSAPASVIDALGLLRSVPAGLRPYVSAVVASRTAEPVARSSATVAVDGAGFRNAYTAPHVKPPMVGKGNPRPTVATVQFAGFKARDLKIYAKKTGLPNIVGTRHYRPISVDGGAGSAANSNGGDIEVALDQESILATAPHANQRPYFAPNTGSAYIDILATVFDDVTQDKQAKRGGDAHIVALSTSWGNCEANYGRQQINAMQSMIKALVAAGVTVFSSSGDAGIYDCGDSTGTGLGNSTAGVDYPASSPQVIGVGGTTLRHRGPVARRNNGHNWRETAWSCHDPQSCEGNGLLPILPGGSGGTGGGESGAPGGGIFGGGPGFGGFKAPKYQKRFVKGPIYGHRKKRMVPDIAADGDPNTGFRLYSSDSQVADSRDAEGLVQVGGTSLSAPLSAALFTNLLASQGRTRGIGDIHRALYKAYAKAGHRVFRDVTQGSNGAAANRGHDPSVRAHKGYDTLTGLGGVIWPRLAAYLHLRN
ncbi:MAG: S53 family peptidase [Frankiaceae bacterium]|nr:S53 family peptidase [Frankiaceae bacterium]MBV9870527.1 S53 family peptidase [Frankiaceae bacterium]